MHKVQIPDSNEDGTLRPQAELISPTPNAPAQPTPKRLFVFARHLVSDLPRTCLILAAVCVVLRITIQEYWAREESRTVDAAVEEAAQFEAHQHSFFLSGGGGYAIFALGGLAKQHSWLWIHMHMDAYETYSSYVSRFYVDGDAVEEFLKASSIRDSVISDGILAQQQLHKYVLWGVGLEVLAILLTPLGIVIAWRKSRPTAVEKAANAAI